MRIKKRKLIQWINNTNRITAWMSMIKFQFIPSVYSEKKFQLQIIRKLIKISPPIIIFSDQCGSNSKMVQGLELPDETTGLLLNRSQPQLISREIFFEKSRKIFHPSPVINWWRRKTRSIWWETEEMHQSE